MAQIEDEQNSPTITPKAVAKYALLPGILPRLQRLTQHASQFLFMFTQIFAAAGLINRNHPCLLPQNVGLYRFSDIVGLAASNVVFDRKHLPQIIMFFAVILSIVLTAAIVLALIASTILTVSSAQAQLFGTPTGVPGGHSYAGANQDWAMNFLYRIFGETGMFDPPADGALGNPWFTAILVNMLKYYSLAMLVVAAFMILYILVITLTEAARTGQPFGTRFDSIWAPIRLALAIGLLMPVMTSGYNGAQMITFQAAIWGSNLATNVWYGGISRAGDGKKFLGTMMSDPGYRFVRDAFLVNLCISGLKAQAQNDSWDAGEISFSRTYNDGYVTYTFGPEDASDFCGQVKYLMKPQAERPQEIPSPSWPEQVAQGYHTIVHNFFPVPSDDSEDSSSGIVLADARQMTTLVNHAAEKQFGSSQDLSEMKYFIDIMGEDYDGANEIRNWMEFYWRQLGVVSYSCGSQTAPNSNFGSCNGSPKRGPYFDSPQYKSGIDAYNKWIIDRLSADARYGWTTAGVFYLRITAAFASVSEVVNNPPVVTKLPANFTKIFATVANPTANTEAVNFECSVGWNNFLGIFGITSDCMKKYMLAKNINRFLRGGNDWFQQSVKKDPKVYGLMDAENFDRALEIDEPDSATNMETGNITKPVLGGLSEYATIDSNDLNPLGVVIQWGNAMITMAFIAFGIALLGKGSGWSDLAFSVGSMLMVPGFVLAYWVPTIPFMHFTFAVIEWMISILEAVIGMPLWALSLITLQGDGLGQVGMEGVKRLFEIVLRPTIIIMALVASVILFSAGVSFFNSAISMYNDARDKGFLTEIVAGPGMLFIYVFGVYTLATSCFKLIDNIPNRFVRWLSLPDGFGSQIKTGMNELTNLIVGGAALKSLQSLGGEGMKVQKGYRQMKASKKKEKLEEEK